MKRALVWVAVVALVLLGHFFGGEKMRGVLDALPALIAALVGWLFAHTQARGRTPLIARAIAAIDGPQWLTDPAIATYARRLTAVWAAWQFALAACAALLALHAHGFFADAARLPSPRMFGWIILPSAVAALFLGEYFLRPRLLPQAPRQGLFDFFVALIRHWPALLTTRVTTDSICEQFHIAASHPALPGHFPGDPIVPGVVMLEHVAAAVRRAFGAEVAGLPQVKFLCPLRPDQSVELRVDRDGAGAKFCIHRGQELVASGTLELRP